VTCTIVNDFESKKLYVVDFINTKQTNFISFDRCVQ